MKKKIKKALSALGVFLYAFLAIFVAVQFALYVGHFTLTLYPFSMELIRWELSLLTLLIFIGILIYNIKVQSEKDKGENGTRIQK